MRISVVTPAYNEAQNLPVLHEHLSSELDAAGVDWEWVIVDDHSGDDTFGVVGRLHAGDRRVRGVRLARNSGSHVAIACGLHLAAGDAAIVLAGDMQDPPAIVAALLARWREGAQVVWAARRHRPGDRGHAGFAVFYYWMMRRVAGLSAMPARGADCFLADRAVLEAFRRRSERGSVLAMVTSLGFRQALVEYDKAPRLSGRSGWTLARKVGLVADSLTAYSALPIRLVALLGMVVIGAGLYFAAAPASVRPAIGPGATAVLAGACALTGMQLLALGVVGEYVWRALDEARRRPPYDIEAAVGGPGAEPRAPVLAGVQ